MPRTNLDRYAAPPIDWLRAAILERMAALHVSQKDLADAAHISYELMRKYFTRSPWSWPDEVRNSVCRKLGLRPMRGVYGMPQE